MLKLHIPARADIFCDTDAAQHFYEVESGSVMLFKILPQGRRQILDIVGPGDFFGLSIGETYDDCASANTPTHALRYEHDELRHSPDLQRRVTEHLLRQQQAQRAHMLLLGKSSAAERVAGLFVEDGWAQKCANLTLTEIADYLGLRAETVSRQMSHLSKAGLVSRSRWGAYVVRDADGLRKMAAS